MKNLFFNINNQIRPGWKVCIALALDVFFSTIVSVIYFVCLIIFSGIILKEPAGNLIKSPLLTSVSYMISPLVMSLVVIVLWLALEKRPLKEMGLDKPTHHSRNFWFGLFLGILSMSLIFLVLLLTNQIKIQNIGSPRISIHLLVDLVLLLLVAIGEELFYRGYCFNILKQTRKRWLPLVASSILFALVHSWNPNIHLLGVINIFLAGLVLALLYIETNNLWMPIGYHLTWNYFQGSVFGFNVSGIKFTSVLETKLLTENIINGGKFGPEGGLLTTLVLLLTMSLLFKLRGRKNLL